MWPPTHPLFPGQDKHRFQLDEWLLPTAPGIGLWLILQFIAFYIAGLNTTIWLPLCLALIGYARFAWHIVTLRKRPFPHRDEPEIPERQDRWTHPCWLLAILVVHSVIYFWGSIGEPLVGIDPWGHAHAGSYVRSTGSLLEPFTDQQSIHYLDAYPPGLPVLVGDSATFGASVPETLIVVNVLTIALSLGWFHCLARLLFGSNGRALAATTILACMPSYLSRHPWGHTQAIGLLLATYFCLWKLAEDAREKSRQDEPASSRIRRIFTVIAASVCLCGTVLTAPSQGLKAALMSTVVFITVVLAKRDKAGSLRIIFAGALAALLVTVAWLGPMYSEYGTRKEILVGCERPISQRPYAEWDLPDIMNPGYSLDIIRERPLLKTAGSGDLDFNAYDFFGFGFPDEVHQYLGWKVSSYYSEGFAPAGCGGVAFVLALVGLGAAIWNRKHGHFSGSSRLQTAIVVWLLFSFVVCILGVLGKQLPFKFFPWRFWFLLSPIVALLAVSGWSTVMEWLRRVRLNHAVGFVLVLGLSVSAAWKIKLNTASLEPRAFEHRSSASGYYSIGKLLGPNARAYPLVGETRFEQTAGVGLEVAFWKRAHVDFAGLAQDWPAAKIADWLRDNDYAHVIICPMFGMRALNRMQKSGQYSVTSEDIRKALEKAGHGLGSTEAPYESIFKSKLRLVIIGEHIARRQADALVASGRFSIVYDNAMVRCLRVH